MWSAPAIMPPMLAAVVAKIRDSSPEAAVAHLWQWAEEQRLAAESAADEHRVAAERLTREANVANKRARRLEAEPEALQECSLEELRQLSGDVERAGPRVRDALTRAAAEDVAVCRVCLERRKDTALKYIDNE